LIREVHERFLSLRKNDRSFGFQPNYTEASARCISEVVAVPVDLAIVGKLSLLPGGAEAVPRNPAFHLLIRKVVILMLPFSRTVVVSLICM
jgi:hypothetical protein